MCVGIWVRLGRSERMAMDDRCLGAYCMAARSAWSWRRLLARTAVYRPRGAEASGLRGTPTTDPERRAIRVGNAPAVRSCGRW